ncbi:MAG: hypothetical protein JXA94_04315 [Parachlamydiales bacterium]|nr:hypothetical protein [Parachlamydiales bacterium]
MATRVTTADRILQSCFVDCKADQAKVKLIFFTDDWNRLTKNASTHFSVISALSFVPKEDPIESYFKRAFKEVDIAELEVNTDSKTLTLPKTEVLMKRILGLMPKKDDDQRKSDIINKELLAAAPRILNPSKKLLEREAAILASRSPQADGAPE